MGVCSPGNRPGREREDRHRQAATQQHHTPIQRAESHGKCLIGEIKKGDREGEWQLPFFFSRPAGI